LDVPVTPRPHPGKIDTGAHGVVPGSPVSIALRENAADLCRLAASMVDVAEAIDRADGSERSAKWEIERRAAHVLAMTRAVLWRLQR
jgi:hypothetical protein